MGQQGTVNVYYRADVIRELLSSVVVFHKGNHSGVAKSSGSCLRSVIVKVLNIYIKPH